ncbi:terminase [Gordonia phage Verity]|uniref:Terminase n=1 Tax=Gordonia phage Verity TaxID=2591211 RepID=A0A514DIP7_9CAUD|nr:exonuclease [Gordonia phage Verity]QDH93488.1 terminase [Gordonia phage Verity]QPO16845.1 terminase [Gordonia phage Delrey21]QXN74128.1 terminase large subunit [Gordonia phage DoctorFroggo]
MTSLDDVASLPATMTRLDKLKLRRKLAEVAVRNGIRLNDTTSPGQLAVKLDPITQRQAPHLEVIDRELTRMLAEPNARVMIFTPSQVGKLVAHDTPVPTPTGWTTHGELRPGDEVYHPSGKVVTVRAISADAHASIRVSTSDGGSIVVHPRHEWTVWDRNRKRWSTMETGDMMRRAYVDRSGRPAFMLPHRDPLEGVDDTLLIDPYTLGVWLGDGSSTKAAITHHADDEYVLPYPKSADCVHQTTGVVTSYYRGGLHTALKTLGVHANKHIPVQYLRASESSRRALLAGLIDSDGTIAKSGQVSFINTNRRLYDGVVELIRTLGYRATIHAPLQPSTSSSGVAGTRVLYRVSFTPHDGIPPARLSRKVAMSHCHGQRRRTSIIGIEPVDPRPGRCVEVDSPDGLYLVGEHMTPTHNSTRVSQWFPFWWLTIRPFDRILMASAEATLARRNGAAVRELVREYGPEFGLNLSPDESSKTDWSIRAGGTMRSRGLRGNFTGQPMDLGIIDDPITNRAQAESLVVRDFVWDWYSSVWSQRKAPTYREVLVMTRWHQDDLAGRLLARDGRVEEGGVWRVVHLPAIAMPVDEKRGVYPDPLGREPGEPLTHPLIVPDDPATWSQAPTHREALTNWWAAKRKMSTARDWSSMSQGLPSSAENALLTDADIRAATAPVPDELTRVVVGVDPSGGEGARHDTAGISAVGLDEHQHAWFLEDRTAVLTPLEWPRAVCLLAYERDASMIVYEKNYGGGMASALITQAWAALQNEPINADTDETMIPKSANCPYVKGVSAKISKVLRAEPIAQAVKTGRAKFAQLGNLGSLTNEFTLWQPGSTWSPGALDAAVYGATEVLPPVGSTTELERPEGRRGQAPGAAQFGGRRRRTA